MNQLAFRQTAVFVSAMLYWSGVIIHAYRIRKHIGLSPNLEPRGLKERLLWLGWFFVILGWIGQPIMMKDYGDSSLFFMMDFLFHPPGILVGMALILLGYMGTLWCYTALGKSWRIGINKNEKTVLVKHGPYHFVRHPIYLFQVIILMGVICLLPTLLSFIILFVHFFCAMVKALDEESYLLSIHGSEYHKYLSQTGRFFPKWRSIQFIRD